MIAVPYIHATTLCLVDILLFRAPRSLVIACLVTEGNILKVKEHANTITGIQPWFLVFYAEGGQRQFTTATEARVPRRDGQLK